MVCQFEYRLVYGLKYHIWTADRPLTITHLLDPLDHDRYGPLSILENTGLSLQVVAPHEFPVARTQCNQQLIVATDYSLIGAGLSQRHLVASTHSLKA